ncbi:hypothetical protein TSUD_66680 [Trifolium subterraneum]|uniref:Uncharacterized protein n=1 Tax=Trifolium subterraneum TaxID=3900 RepID=A0A2Z6MR44_TRISU|nr:hypothetical protein TSUD_66680 [Trifolium subterraneum]
MQVDHMFEGLRVDSSEVIDEDNTQFAPTFSYSNTDQETRSHSMNNISSEEPYNNKSNGFFLSLGSCRRKGAPKRSPLS